MDEILKLAPLEERIYRHRCVEGWSIVVPGSVFLSARWSISSSLPRRRVSSLSKAITILAKMPLGRYAGISLPYVKVCALTKPCTRLRFFASACMAKRLPNQDGAPVRMILPWKYGFKSIKSLVKIRFVKDQPPTTWNVYSSQEYGFYSNVNPEVDHPAGARLASAASPNSSRPTRP